MNKWLKQVASHPVGANTLGTILGGGILAFLTWLWSASHFSTNGAVVLSGAKAGIVSVIYWLAAPVTVSRLVLWLIIGALVLGWLMATRAKLRLSQVATKTAVNEHVRDTLVAALQVPVKPALIAASLTFTQRLMFHVLYRQYP